MFARAVAAIGDAASIARLESLSRTLQRQIVGWLYPLECVVRRLLLAEAAELRRLECARVARGPRVIRIPLRGMAMHHAPQAHGFADRGRASPPASRSIDLSQPEAWRAQFSFALPRNLHLVPNARAPRIINLWSENTAPAPAPASRPRVPEPKEAPFRLARRMEALRRVLENPRPYAERLVRALQRQARRVPSLVQRYAWSGSRIDDFDPADARLSLDALRAAFDAPKAFEDSS
jgi:hypothetical protein